MLYNVNRIDVNRLRENEDKLQFQTSIREIAWTLRADTGVPMEETVDRVLRVLANYLRCETACLLTVEGVRMGVNVSFVQLALPRFTLHLKETLRNTGLDPVRLEIGVTESAVGEYSQSLRSTLSEIKRMGISIAMDDYGADYSGLRRLSELTIDRIKIDKALINQLTQTDGRGATIVANIVELARELGLSTIAEGAEHEKQIDMLTTMGCHDVQGFYYYRPRSAADAAEVLKRQAAI